MINDVKQLWFKIIYFNSSYSGGKTLVPNKLGLGIFIDEGKPELTNKSNRTGLIIGISNHFSTYLPIQSDYSNSSNGYGDNYAHNLYEILNLKNLRENSLKNNSILRYDNVDLIDNRLLMNGIKNKTILYKSIFENNLTNEKSLFPLKINWEMYRIANSEFWEKYITIQSIIKENFMKKEKIIMIDNKKFGYIKAGKIIASSSNQVDEVFKTLKDDNRTLFEKPEFYKNEIEKNLDNIKKQYLVQKNFVCDLFYKTVEEKYLKYIVNKNDWWKNVDGREEFNGIWKDYESQKDKNKNIFIVEKRIVDNFGNEINYAKENHINKNINEEKKNIERER